MSTITVLVQKWDKGWDLILPDGSATSVRYLHQATQQVRDFLDTVLPEEDHSATEITFTYDLEGIDKEIEEAKTLTKEAAKAQQEAAQKTRAVIHKLRQKNYTVQDVADLLGVTKSRISQLANS